MSAMSRNKGKAGEREVAALLRDLLGVDVRRRVRQHEGDSDLLGVPGWSIEVKRYKAAGRAEIARWWAQCVAQAGEALPVLFYRLDRDGWRTVWPLAAHLGFEAGDMWIDYDWTVEGSPEAWAAAVRELNLGRQGATAVLQMDAPGSGTSCRGTTRANDVFEGVVVPAAGACP